MALRRPFDVDDTVEIAGMVGKVSKIEKRATVIQTLDGLVVTLPHKDVFQNPIINYTSTPERRMDLAYHSPLDQVREIVLEVGNETRYRDPARAPEVFLNGPNRPMCGLTRRLAITVLLTVAFDARADESDFLTTIGQIDWECDDPERTPWGMGVLEGVVEVGRHGDSVISELDDLHLFVAHVCPDSFAEQLAIGTDDRLLRSEESTRDRFRWTCERGDKLRTTVIDEKGAARTVRLPCPVPRLPRGLTLTLTRRGHESQSALSSHPHLLHRTRSGFLVRARFRPRTRPIWSQSSDGSTTSYSFEGPQGVETRLRVTETAPDKGQSVASASAVLESRTSTGWRELSTVPPGPLTEHMEPIPDVTGDGIPEVFRLESRVPCDGGPWAQVLSVLPEPRVLATYYVEGKGCDR